MMTRIATRLRRLWQMPSRRSAANKKVDSLPRWDSADSLQRQFSATGKQARANAYLKAFVVGSQEPAKQARDAAKAAVAAEHAKVQDRIAKCGAAERAHIRARFAMQTAGLKLRQAERKFGSHSLAAHQARQVNLKAIRAYGAASANLYVAQMDLA